MAKCVICSTQNLFKQLDMHPSQSILSMIKIKLDALRRRDEKVIAKICEEHRYPLRFNVEVMNLFESYSLIAKGLAQIKQEEVNKAVDRMLMDSATRLGLLPPGIR